MRKRYRVVNKTRFFTFVTSLIVIVLMIISSIFFKAKAHSSLHMEEFYEIEVKEGDTLWEIAGKYLPGERDIRKKVYRIKIFNGMDSANIFPGDIIKVPKSNK